MNRNPNNTNISIYFILHKKRWEEIMSKWEKQRLICYKHDKINHQMSFGQNSLCHIYQMKTTKKTHEDYDVENDKRHPSPYLIFVRIIQTCITEYIKKCLNLRQNNQNWSKSHFACSFVCLFSQAHVQPLQCTAGSQSSLTG